MSKRRNKSERAVPQGFWPGAFSGYRQYRHGETRKPTLPKIYSGSARASLIDKVMDEMRDWRFTPFENEGPMTHALRSTLCLDGNAFERADMEARSVVGQVLHDLGAERPSWEQGQPEYVDPRENCTRCGKTILEVYGHKSYRFCSEVCAKATIENREFERRSEEDRVYAAAQRIIKKTRTRPRACAWCGEAFHPIREASRQQCCSFSCGSKLRASRVTRSIEKECDVCGKAFLAMSSQAKRCSTKCGTFAGRVERGEIAKLSSKVFDYLMLQSGARITLDRQPSKASPEALDWFFMEIGCRITAEVRVAG